MRLGDLRDVKSGAEFEDYLSILFEILGYHTENMKLTGDQGIDVLLAKGKIWNGKKKTA
ncbi:MAG: restriction endonuclease [Muricoprocola sp.]